MAGGRGRGGGRAGSSPQQGGRYTDSPGSHDRGRGRGRSSDRGRGGRGRGAGRDAATPGRGSWSAGSPAGAGGGYSRSNTYGQSPGAQGRGAGRTGKGHWASAEASGPGLGVGLAAVAAEDRNLLLVSKDAKSPRVWEVRKTLQDSSYKLVPACHLVWCCQQRQLLNAAGNVITPCSAMCGGNSASAPTASTWSHFCTTHAHTAHIQTAMQYMRTPCSIKLTFRWLARGVCKAICCGRCAHTLPPPPPPPPAFCSMLSRPWPPGCS